MSVDGVGIPKSKVATAKVHAAACAFLCRVPAATSAARAFALRHAVLEIEKLRFKLQFALLLASRPSLFATETPVGR